MSRRRALLVVDVQQGFVDVVGDDGPRVLREVNRLVEQAIRDREPIFYTRDRDPFDVPDGDPADLIALHPGLRIAGTVVDKGPGRRGYMSGFLLADDAAVGHGSVGPLAAELRLSGADEVTVVGIAADVCVAATARDAVRLGYGAQVRLAASAFVHAHPEGDGAAIAELRTAGVTVR